MARSRRFLVASFVIVCFAGAQGNATLFASSGDAASVDASPLQPSALAVDGHPFADAGLTANAPLGFLAAGSRSTFDVASVQSNAFAAQVYRGRPIRSDRSGSIAAMMFGAAATITGAALLIYANRPDCNAVPSAGGCGYGTKVVGGSVLTGGIVGLMVGALTWK